MPLCESARPLRKWDCPLDATNQPPNFAVFSIVPRTPKFSGRPLCPLTRPVGLPYAAGLTDFGIMHIIDRYLLRQFLQTFLICFLSLTGLYIVFDAFTNLEEFVRCGAKCGGVIPFMARHYAFQALGFFDRTGGLLALVSAMFTVSWIQRHNEMTALMAAGIARIRVLLPIIFAAVTISLLAAANRELLIPRFRHELCRRPQDLIGDLPQSLEPRYDDHDVLLSGKNTYADRKRIEEPEFALPPLLRDYGKQLSPKTPTITKPRGNGRADTCSKRSANRRTSTPGHRSLSTASGC